MTYNFCISPLSPAAISGLVWIPGPQNIGRDPARYGAALGALAASVGETWGRAEVPFFYAQPAPELVDGLSAPEVSAPGGVVPFASWPRSARELADAVGGLAAGARR